jgi:hypothetical protein
MEIDSLLGARELFGQMVSHQRNIARAPRANIHGGLLAAIGMEVPAKRKKELLW